jgi:lipopolysaccharide heptosyltransferase II
MWERKYNRWILHFGSALVSFAFFRWKRFCKLDINRILIIKTDFIGDIVLSIPIICGIRNNFPGRHIALLAPGNMKNLMVRVPFLNEVIVYDSPRYHPYKENRTTLAGIKELFSKIRRKKFDLIIDFRGDWVTVFLSLFSGCKYRLDFDSYLVSRLLRKKFRCFWGNGKSPKPAPDSLHIINRFRDFLGKYSIKTQGSFPILSISDNAYDMAKKSLKRAGAKEDVHLFTIHIGSQAPSKCWPIDRFVRLTDKITKELKIDVAFVGGPDDRKLIEKALTMKNQPALNLAGQLSLEETAALISTSEMFIGNDSGPAHIAAAVGTPSVVLFGPTDPSTCAPVGKNVIVIRKKINCDPCCENECPKKINECMSAISVDDVLSAAYRLLNNIE